MVYYLNLLGTAIFAVGGALAAARKGMDLFGVVVAAILTAMGGGTLRDLCLGISPVNWVTDSSGIVIAVISGGLTFALVSFRRLSYIPFKYLNVADAFGLALFTAIGCETALSLNANPIVVVIMGMLTGSGGGIIRDVFSGEIPLFFRKEIYATACLIGGVAYLVFLGTAATANMAMIGGAVVTLAIRLSAIRWGLSLPNLAQQADTIKM
ncbi:MAG: trimeric intracellular cation channel family protein [Pseudomonadota bacterium]